MAEIIIEVIDARMIEETRNEEIEKKIRAKGKILLYGVTKCDLVDVSKLKKRLQSLKPAVFISGKEKLGTTILKKKILELSKGESVVVGVVGYPNVGKSSLINALAGRGAARTSSESGFTKGMQKIKVDNKIMVLDTPGVYPHMEKDEIKHGRIGAIGYSKVKDPESVALNLIEEMPEKVKKYYGVEGEDAEEILEAVAFRLKRLQKGGEPDLEAASRSILKDWQTGRMK